MRIRDIILPEDKIFFTLFAQMAGAISESAAVLNEITHELPCSLEKGQRIRQLEHTGDEITKKTYEKLDESLITPLEPEEISRLAPVLDTVLDRIDRVANQICTYNLPESNDVLREYSYLIVLSTNEIARAVNDLPSLKKGDPIREHVSEINRLYNLSSELLARAVLDLFKTNDTLCIIKFKDIYENMERVLESCNDVGHALRDIAACHS
ncbi:MAG: DUF47 family protein [Methanoregulaceae archaeon]